MRAACSMLATCYPLQLPTASQAGALLCVRRLRATRARAAHGPLPALRAGLFDASVRFMTLQAWQKMLSVIGGAYKERWPDDELRIIFLTTLFDYKERITALTFLYGNLRDVDLVYTAVHPQFGVDPRDLDHARRFLADLASGRYDHKYFYFDVLTADWLFLNGKVNTRHAPPTPFARALHAWERECMRVRREHARWPNLVEQHAHFACD